MKNYSYIEISDYIENTLYTATPEAKEVMCTNNRFSGKQRDEDEFEFKFEYNVPTKKVRLSLTQIEDLINFMAIYNDLNPDWKDPTKKLVKAVEIG